MELKLVPLEIPENGNLILGQSHFIKTVEDIYETIVNTVPQMKFAVTSLIVEHGVKPAFNPSFWLTSVSTLPLFGSTTSTLPLVVPNALTAARRTVRSSPSTLSPSVGSTGGGFFTAFLTIFFLMAVAAFPLPGALLLVAWPAANWPLINRPATSAGNKNFFIVASYETQPV